MHTLQQLQNGELAGAVSLKLSEGFSHFPEEIFCLADTLEILDLSRNRLTELPADLGRLKKLRILFCSENPFTTLPEVLADLPQLDIAGFKACQIETIPPRALNPNVRWLILTDNTIKELPKEIGKCTRMQKLMLAGNQLGAIPVELSNCRNLSLLRISANLLTELPRWLLSMPRLAWLACSGNPFSLRPDIAPLPSIPWQDLHIHHVLGQGASGITFMSKWQNREDLKDVAVKVFKGSVTSDGLPEDEMRAFIAAGKHPGLVVLIGQLSRHPEGKQGLVMELIPKRFRNLGLPPSFESCTRDVFAPGTSIRGEHVLRITCAIASVAKHLHGRGIMHGDLYAHNTLVDENGDALLSDFGGASFYDSTDTTIAHLLERLEVAAFGYMLDDLLSVCSDTRENKMIQKLEKLRDLSIAPDVSLRPGFEYLAEELSRP